MTNQPDEQPAITPDHPRYPRRRLRITTFGAEWVEEDQHQETDHGSD